MRLSEIIRPYGDKSLVIDTPFWGIVINTPHGKALVTHGIWFKCEDATRFFDANRRRYSKSAHVYCFSGWDSWHMKELDAMARAVATPVFTEPCGEGSE